MKKTGFILILSFFCVQHSLRSQHIDPVNIIHESEIWWNASGYSKFASIFDLPIRPLWSEGEVVAAPFQTNLVVFPIESYHNIKISKGWDSIASSPNGGVYLVLTRFSFNNYQPSLCFIYAYNEYLQANFGANVYEKNKPHSLDTCFSGEVFYTNLGLSPDDTLDLLYGLVFKNGRVTKHFYPNVSNGDLGRAVGYRCCKQLSRIETSKVEIDGREYVVREVVIIWDCSGCGGSGGSGGTGGIGIGNWGWHPGGPTGGNETGGGGGGGGGSTGGNGTGNHGYTKEDGRGPGVYPPLCPDGSRRPASGLCKCPDGTPMPPNGCQENGDCELTYEQIMHVGHNFEFYIPVMLPANIRVTTVVVGTLVDCKKGIADYDHVIYRIEPNVHAACAVSWLSDYSMVARRIHDPSSKKWVHETRNVHAINLDCAEINVAYKYSRSKNFALEFVFSYK